MPIALSGPLTRTEVMDHLSRLEAEIQTYRGTAPAAAVPATIEVDLGGLTRVDTSALAMMLAVEREAQAQGVAVRWLSMPSSLRALARLSSVEPLFRST